MFTEKLLLDDINIFIKTVSLKYRKLGFSNDKEVVAFEIKNIAVLIGY